MVSLSRRVFSSGSLPRVAVFALLCIGSMWLAVALQLGPYGLKPSSVFGPTVGFAVIMTGLAMVLGLFRIDERASLALVLSRTMMVLAIGFPIAYLFFTIVPGGRSARDVLGYAGLYTLSSVILMRAAVSAVLGVGIGARRVLIIGTGDEALAVEDAQRKLQYDLYYVKNHSLALDIQVLVETIRVVIFGEGAH